MPGGALEQPGDEHIAPRRRQEDKAQIHGGIKDAVLQSEPPPAQELEGEHAAPDSCGHGKEYQTHPQEAAAFAVARQQGQHRHPQLAEGMEKKAHARQDGGGGVGRPDGRPQSQPAPAEYLAGQASGGQQQEIVHHKVEQEQLIQIDHRHPASPPCPLACRFPL